MTKYLFILAGMALSLTTEAHSQDADAILGEWLTDGGESLVEIYKCGDRYCAKIVWLKDPQNEDGSDKLDTNNPDPSKRSQRIIGLNIVWEFRHKRGTKWEDGKIYDPENGKTYSCKMELEGNKLNVRGYMGVSFFGRTTVWTKGALPVPK